MYNYMSMKKRKVLWQWYCHCEEQHLKLFWLYKNYVNVNWISKLIQKFASRQKGHMWLICVVFSLNDKPSLMLSKKQLTWQSVQQHLAKLKPNMQNKNSWQEQCKSLTQWISFNIFHNYLYYWFWPIYWGPLSCRHVNRNVWRTKKLWQHLQL